MNNLQKYIHEKLSDLNLSNEQTAVFIGDVMEAVADATLKGKPDFEEIVDTVLTELKY